MVEILFLAHNRKEFTRAALQALVNNTAWSRVSRIVLYDDGSEDGTEVLLRRSWPCASETRTIPLGGPVAIMNHYLANGAADIFAKLDNDVIVPPSWLEACESVMQGNRELGLLGIEPPLSRTPAPWAKGVRIPAPELAMAASGAPAGQYRYARCDAIGGIGLMRRSVFAVGAMIPAEKYFGFTDFQIRHREIVSGWIAPPLNVFLLDRLPIEPWASLSREYLAQGWQRPWTSYDPGDCALWQWWIDENGPANEELP